MSTKQYKRTEFTTMIKTAIFLGMGFASLSFGQNITTYPQVVTASQAKSPALPSYVVYHHFLAWASALDQDAKHRGLADPYVFASPFAHSLKFDNNGLDLIRKHAKRHTDDLIQQDAKAAAVIKAYRQSAMAALKSGQPLPPAPAKLQELEQQKTAMMIHQYVLFRSELGQAQSSKLDTYLSREFVPHINVGSVSANTKLSPAAKTPVSADSFAVALH